MFSFFNPPKPRQFHYEPRYYKPEEEPDENGNEATEREKLERKLKRSWNFSGSTTRNRRPMFSIFIIAGVTVLLVIFIGSKGFLRMFEVFGKKPQTEFSEMEPPAYRIHKYYQGDTLVCDTIYKGEIGGIFSRRIDSLAFLAFRGDFGDDEQMREKLGDEYEIVKMRLDQILEDYERTNNQ